MLDALHTKKNGANCTSNNFQLGVQIAPPEEQYAPAYRAICI